MLRLLRRLLAQEVGLGPSALAFEQLVEGHHLILGLLLLTLPAPLLILLLDPLSELSTGLEIELGRRGLLLDNGGFFVTQENLDLLPVVPDQDHVVEPYHFLLQRLSRKAAHFLCLWHLLDL